MKRRDFLVAAAVAPFVPTLPLAGTNPSPYEAIPLPPGSYGWSAHYPHLTLRLKIPPGWYRCDAGQIISRDSFKLRQAGETFLIGPKEEVFSTHSEFLERDFAKMRDIYQFILRRLA